MKKGFLFLLLASRVFTAAAQEPATGYALFGIYKKAEGSKSVWCQDQDFELVKIGSREAYENEAKAFRERHKGADAFPRLLKPGQASLVYESSHAIFGWGCSPKYMDLITAPNIDSARKLLEEAVRKHPKDFLTTPREVYIQENGQATGTVRKESNISGVIVRYVLREKEAAGKSILVITVKNTNVKLAANYELVSNGHSLIKKHLLPGDTFSTPLEGVLTFTSEVELAVPQDKVDDPSLIGFIKKKVKEKVTVDPDKRIINNGTAIGIRG